MKKRIANILAVSAVAMCAFGCPTDNTPQPMSNHPMVEPGTWSFERYDSNGIPINAGPSLLVLLANGTTQTFGGGGGGFTGTLTWMQDVEIFRMNQVDGPDEYSYAGIVFSANSMAGTVTQTAGGSFFGSWEATFVPPRSP